MATDAWDRGAERTIEDVLEQQTPVDPQEFDAEGPTTTVGDAAVEADPADVLDQQRIVPDPDDQHRRG